MKKIISLLIMIFVGFFLYAQEKKSDDVSVEELLQINSLLQEENTELRKLIYESATIEINGKKIKTRGLLEGLALCYAKYESAIDKLSKGGNYVEITDAEIYKYKNVSNNIKELNVKLESIYDKKNTKSNESFFYKIFNLRIEIMCSVIIANLLIILILIIVKTRNLNLENEDLYKIGLQTKTISQNISTKLESGVLNEVKHILILLKDSRKELKSGLTFCKDCGKPIFTMNKKKIDFKTLKEHCCKKADITRYKKYLEKQK